MKKKSMLKMLAGFGLWLLSVVLCALGCFFIWMVTEWNVFNADFYSTQKCSNMINERSTAVQHYFQLQEKQNTGKLDFIEQSQMQEYAKEISLNSDSNFIWRVVDTQGKTLESNQKNDSPISPQVHRSFTNSFDRLITESESDNVSADNTVFIEYGVKEPMTVHDGFYENEHTFLRMKSNMIVVGAAGLTVFALFVLLAVYLSVTTGFASDGVTPVITPFDHIWLEFLAVLLAGLLTMIYYELKSHSYIAAAAFLGIGLGFGILTLLSVIRRIRAQKMYETSFLHVLVSFGNVVHSRVRLSFQIAGMGVLYMLFQVIAFSTKSLLLQFLMICFDISLVIIAIIVASQYMKVKKTIEQMASGNMDSYVDLNKVTFFSDVARNLNSAHRSIQLSVEQATKSERMKTELITNVSHDIKTPLTSIISYVSLLKNTKIENPQAEEYIEILDSKSRRLAQLMIDLVDASKVSSGNVNVKLEAINLSELLSQAAAEYQSRMEERGIELICHLPDYALNVLADGRHMWRALDNIFGNACKYSMENTRVYVDVADTGANVVLSVKNVSREPLNINSDELMERFVRGDSSRSTQGSGLGLSIAKSLVELQHGTLTLQIDGDLFKVIIVIPKPIQAYFNSATVETQPKS